MERFPKTTFFIVFLQIRAPEGPREVKGVFPPLEFTSNSGSWSFDQKARGGTPSFMARKSSAHDAGETHPTLGDLDIFGTFLGYQLGVFRLAQR